MKGIWTFVFAVIFFTLSALAQAQPTFERKGLILGASLGVSSIEMQFGNEAAQSETGLSLPNIKIGAMLGERTAILLYLPGNIYRYDKRGRSRDRGLEGIIPSLQYCPGKAWWVQAGAGLMMDAPAFYDIREEEEAKFYFGGAGYLSTGYELWRKGNMALDLQARVYTGKAKGPEGDIKGRAISLLLGINWY